MSTEKRVDAALVDVVCSYCALNNCTTKDLVHLSFGEVLKRFADLCRNHQEWVMVSKQIRDTTPICHQECHIERIQIVMRDLTPEVKEVRTTGNVVEFPTNHTKH